MVRERLVVVAPGPDTLRWVGTEASTHPALVAVGRDGRPRYYAEQVLSSVAGQWGDFQLVSPFSAVELLSTELTLAYMRWLVTSSPHAARRTATVLVVPAESQFSWRAIGDRLPGETVVLVRPITVAAGLGLDVDSSSPHLVADVRADGAEVSVVCESEVKAATEVANPRVELVASAAEAMLGDLDPDLEYDARRKGVYAIGVERGEAERLADLLQVPVRVTSRPDRVLAQGVLADRRLIEAYFGTRRPRLQRLIHRTHRPIGAG